MTKNEEFALIYTRYHLKVFRLCKGYFKGDEELAGDISQEIFIKIWQHMDSFRQESMLSTWIYRISVNCCLQHMRKPILRKEIRLQELPDLVQDEYNPARDQQLQKMYSCIGSLDEVGKMIILLVLERVEYSEIATVVGITEETLRVRIHRIKLKLTNCVKL